MRPSAWGPWLVVSLFVATSTASAFARRPSGSGHENQDSCFSAPVKGQKLQRAGKLIEARSRFTMCARNTCPRVVSQSCKHWLEQVRAAIPTVQFSARDQDGLDVSGVRISIDGNAAISLGPGAVEVDPGQHEFVFHHDGNADVTRRVMINKGSKKVGISVIFPVAPAPTPPPPTPKPTPQRDTGKQSVPGTPSRPVPTLSWVLGGVGVAGLASFATFGTLGLVQRGSSDCSQSAPHGTFDSCQNGAFTKFRIADISLGVAVVGLGAATWLYLKRPTVYERSTVLAVGVAPTAHGAVATVGATF